MQKNSPYQKAEPTTEEKIMQRLRGMKVSELKKEIVRLELELEAARKKQE